MNRTICLLAVEKCSSSFLIVDITNFGSLESTNRNGRVERISVGKGNWNLNPLYMSISNGLILFKAVKKSQFECPNKIINNLWILNPTTKKLIEIPPAPLTTDAKNIFVSSYGICSHSCLEGDIRLLFGYATENLLANKCLVYSLKKRNWSSITDVPFTFVNGRAGISVGPKCFWLGKSVKTRRPRTKVSLFSFDFETSSFEEIKIPDHIDTNRRLLISVSGVLGLSCRFSTAVDIWFFIGNEGDTKQNWVHLHLSDLGHDYEPTELRYIFEHEEKLLLEACDSKTFILRHARSKNILRIDSPLPEHHPLCFTFSPNFISLSSPTSAVVGASPVVGRIPRILAHLRRESKESEVSRSGTKFKGQIQSRWGLPGHLAQVSNPNPIQHVDVDLLSPRRTRTCRERYKFLQKNGNSA